MPIALADDTAPDIEIPPVTNVQRLDLVIRRARVQDVDALAGELGSRAFFEDRLHRQAENKGRLLVAELGGNIVGTVYLWLEQAEEKRIRTHLPRVPLLTHLEVKESSRAHGVGTKLITAVEEEVARLGRQRIALAVRTDNPKARRLYERLNYRIWGFGTVKCRKYDCPRRTLEKCDVLTKSVTAATQLRLVS